MKKTLFLLLIGLFFISCGENKSTNEDTSIDLPNALSLKDTTHKFMAGGKDIFLDDDNSNENSSNDSANNSNDTSINSCRSGSIKLTDKDRDVLEYNNPDILYDFKYNSNNDTFCIRWESRNDAILEDDMYYSYDNNSWKTFKVNTDKSFIITQLENSLKYNKIYIKVEFGGYDNDLNQYVGSYYIVKEFNYKPKINKAPTVNAGADITTYINEEVTLTGNASDSDGNIISYEWKKGSDILATTKVLNYIPTQIGVDTLTFTVTDNDGLSNSDTINITVKNRELTEKEVLLNEPHKLLYGYYRDKKHLRWYISPIKNGEKVPVYSLMPIKNGKAGWGLVTQDKATIDLIKEQVTIGNIANNTSGDYYVAVWDETIKSNRVEPDIEKIKNSTVDINWWFFKASNGSWYIINKQGSVYRFSYKDVTVNGISSQEYDWKKIDLDNEVPTFFVENGAKKFKF